MLPTDKSLFKYSAEKICDFKDGSLYQEFLKNFDNSRIEFIYTFCLNTDGISLCSKSNLTIWPVYLTINEIDKKCRFSPDLVLLAGTLYFEI